MIKSHTWPSDFTLRFPRVEKIRFNKEWTECMSLEELKDFTETLKRKVNQSESDNSEKEGEGKGSAKKNKKIKKEFDKRRQGAKTNQVLPQFQDTDVSGVEVISALFKNCVIHIINLGDTSYDAQLAEKVFYESNIARYGGKKVQNDNLDVTHYIAGKLDIRVKSIIAKYDRCIIKPKWISDCIQRGEVLDLAPRYLLYANDFMRTNNFIKYDKFGDSYTKEVDVSTLKDIMREMDYMGYEDDLDDSDITQADRAQIRQTCAAQGMHMSRSKICLLDPNGVYRSDMNFVLLRIKVVMLGGKIVYDLADQNIDIIVAYSYSPAEVQKIQGYIELNQGVEVRSIDFLMNLI